MGLVPSETVLRLYFWYPHGIVRPLRQQETSFYAVRVVSFYPLSPSAGARLSPLGPGMP